MKPDDAKRLYEQLVQTWEEKNGKIESPHIVPYEYQEVLKQGHDVSNNKKTVKE